MNRSFSPDHDLLTRLLDTPPTLVPTHRASPSARTALFTVAAFLVVYLALTTLGASLWLALVVALAMPVIIAWWLLCGVLETHEPALNAMLDERVAALHETALALRKDGNQ